jgi:hypothetical protein
MKLIFRILFLVILFLGFLNQNDAYGQKKTRSMRQIERRAKKSDGLLSAGKSKKVARAERKAEKTKKNQEEAYERAKRKDKKHRLEIQTQNTRDMMNHTEQKSEQARKDKREPFFKRLFKRKPR